MPRPPRYIDPDYQYHLMVRGSNKSVVFRDHEDYEQYYQLMRCAKKEQNMKIYHYSFMPNHAHDQIKPGQPTIASFLHRIQLQYSRYFCRKYGFAGHIWQGHPKCKLIETETYSLACGSYIEHNPVRAGLVESPGDWQFSSYNFYAFGHPDPLVDVDPLYRELGRTPTERQENYRRLVGRMRRV